MNGDAAAELAAADRAALVAPAGYGKTWTLARAAAQSEQPQLILTHTHAGIHALRRHLTDAGLLPDGYRLDTIAGYASRWAAVFPQLAGWTPEEPEPDWTGLYPAASRVIERPQIQATIARSYRGVLVDEYQDCSVAQHDLLLSLGQVLPVRVVGDPLQGIFDFADPLVEFETDVFPEFPLLGSLEKPWRWEDNPALGQDLVRLRSELEAGEVPDLSTYTSIRVRGGHPSVPVQACQDVAGLGGSAVAIRKYSHQAHKLAARLGGRFVSMEEAEGKDVVKAATDVEAAEGPVRAATLLKILESCTTKVVPAIRKHMEVYEAGRLPDVPRGRAGPLIEAFNALAQDPTLTSLPHAVETACGYPNTVVYRPEIPKGLMAAAARLRSEGNQSLPEAVRAIRDGERRVGRRLPQRVVSRTLLVKGLQFDHAVVFDTTEHDRRNLYVALTRASSTVTVVTR